MTQRPTSKLPMFVLMRSCGARRSGELSLAKTACFIFFVFCITSAIASPAQTFTTLVSFDGADGAYPYAALVQGANGNFYGTTYDGGTHSDGTVFEMTQAGELTTLYNFCAQPNCSDGAVPYGLMLATNGNFYGITYNGGIDNTGTIFEITPAGQLTTIYRFCSQTECDDGIWPRGTLLQGRNGNFYGTTSHGGVNGAGTVFEVTAAGALTTLHTFGFTDGSYPESGLVQATSGSFYGTTSEGGHQP